MADRGGILVLALAILAVGAGLLGLVSYLQMMRAVPAESLRFHAQRLRVRQNLLFLAAPELFTGAAATYRRRYVAALVAFVVAIALFAALAGR
jgi:hypothetical protein